MGAGALALQVYLLYYYLPRQHMTVPRVTQGYTKQYTHSNNNSDLFTYTLNVGTVQA